MFIVLKIFQIWERDTHRQREGRKVGTRKIGRGKEEGKGKEGNTSVRGKHLSSNKTSFVIFRWQFCSVF